jgi:hypothetical protein
MDKERAFAKNTAFMPGPMLGSTLLGGPAGKTNAMTRIWMGQKSIKLFF